MGAGSSPETSSGKHMHFGSEARWIIVAILLGLAAAIAHLMRRRLWALAATLAIAPLPAFVFLRLTIPTPAGAPGDQVEAGFVLSALACYLPPALGALTAFLVERANT
ncbi:MAG: hypothetical protein U1E30_03995, partial [Rhodoblastus sp.]